MSVEAIRIVRNAAERAGGIRVLSLKDFPLRESDFQDGVHLTDSANRKFQSVLRQVLASSSSVSIYLSIDLQRPADPMGRTKVEGYNSEEKLIYLMRAKSL